MTQSKPTGPRHAGAVMAIDQGTTSTRTLIFNDAYEVIGSAQIEFDQHFPASGHVEHDPEDLIDTTIRTMRDALADAGLAAGDLAGIGITNQRETTVIWDRDSGRAIHRAIVWQDRRTAPTCAALRDDGVDSCPGRTAAPQRKPGDRAICASRWLISASQMTSSQVPLKLPRRYRSDPAVPITSLISSAKGARVSSTSAVISGSGSMTSEKIGINRCWMPRIAPSCTSRSTRETNLPWLPLAMRKVFPT
jgi:hypothetical protein